MRTAEEIIKETGYEDGDEFSIEDVSEMINKARIEAIKECAEVAEIEIPFGPIRNRGNEKPIVDKASILKLIDQVK